jgi:D-alanyl-D-alanine carboxypeptidase
VNQKQITSIIEKTIRKKSIYGIVLGIESTNKSISYFHSAGNISVDSPYYIASINKLIVSSIILRYIRDGKMNFNDLVWKFLPERFQHNLLVIDSVDYTSLITIEHLLTQTSGLPCYLIDKPQSGLSGMHELESGIDKPWPIDRVIERVQQLRPYAKPGSKCRYIDTNHQLLTLVIEMIENQSAAQVINQVFKDLQMNDTYVYQNTADTDFIYPYYKTKPADIRHFMASSSNDIISTTRDQMIFIKAFFSGYFYPKEKIKELEKWNDIFFPFRYGVGIQQFYTPRIFSPFKEIPEMIGHCGSTGSVMFYIRKLDLFVTGTTNQQANPQAVFQTIMRIIYTLV